MGQTRCHGDPRNHSGLTLDALGEALGAASTVLRANAMAAGLDAPVPTCPGWTVLDLVAHQGMVHRWAASHLRGEPSSRPNRSSARGASRPTSSAGSTTARPRSCRRSSTRRTTSTRSSSSRTPPHRACSGLGGSATRRRSTPSTRSGPGSGGRPRADETWIRPAVALDGIDELLVGFVTRRREGASPGSPTRLLVRPDSADVAWLVDLAPGRPISTRRVGPASPEGASADHTLTGDPVDLYLRLWSRSAAEPADELERWWRDTVSVTW